MIFVAAYLVLLFIAPQLWVGPVMGLRVDLFLYPAWLAYVVLRGRLPLLLRFRSGDWFFLGFVLWSAVTVVAHGMPQRGQDIVQNLAKWFVLYRLTVASTADRGGLRRAAKLLVLVGIVLSVEGIQHYWSADGLGWAGQTFGWVDEAAATLGLDKRTRWVNIFDGPGVFCVVYTIALPFVLQYLASPWGWFTRIAALAPTGLLMLAIFYTGSRGGWVTTLVLVGAWMALRSGISAPRLAALGALGLVFVMAGPSYLTSTRDSSNSAQRRVEMWGEGIEMVQQNPLLGIGRGNFANYTGRLIAHNSAVEIMGESGIVGLFLWVGVLYCGFKCLRHSIRETEDDHDRAYARSLVLCLTGYLVSAMFVTLEYETLYFLLALAAARGEDLDEPPTFDVRDGLAVLAIMLGFFAMVKGFVMIYFA